VQTDKKTLLKVIIESTALNITNQIPNILNQQLINIRKGFNNNKKQQ
jgi:hypothetical protein